jgi:hypothetical protein
VAGPDRGRGIATYGVLNAGLAAVGAARAPRLLAVRSETVVVIAATVGLATDPPLSGRGPNFEPLLAL